MTANRTKYEEELAEALLAALLALRKSIERGVPDYRQFTQDATQAFTGVLAEAYADAADTLAGTHEVALDASQVDEEAANYGATVGAMMARGMAENTAAALSDMARVGGALQGSHLFSGNRAASAAVTEITRSITQGSSLAARVIAARMAKRIVARWRTERDDAVCPICKPLDGREEFGPNGFAEVVPGGPPAHPYCRCELVYRFEPLVAAGV